MRRSGEEGKGGESEGNLRCVETIDGSRVGRQEGIGWRGPREGEGGRSERSTDPSKP